jgi:hypothetical protein
MLRALYHMVGSTILYLIFFHCRGRSLIFQFSSSKRLLSRLILWYKKVLFWLSIFRLAGFPQGVNMWPQLLITLKSTTCGLSREVCWTLISQKDPAPAPSCHQSGSGKTKTQSKCETKGMVQKNFCLILLLTNLLDSAVAVLSLWPYS